MIEPKPFSGKWWVLTFTHIWSLHRICTSRKTFPFLLLIVPNLQLMLKKTQILLDLSATSVPYTKVVQKARA